MNNNVERLNKMISEGKPETLEYLYRRSDETGILNRGTIMKIWYGITPLQRCGADTIKGMLALFGDEPVQTRTQSQGIHWLEDKVRFLESGVLPAGAIRRSESFLNSFAKIEAERKCDIGEMSVTDIAQAISGLNNYNRTYLRSQLNTINAYLRWRRDNNLAVYDSSDIHIVIEDIDIVQAMKVQCYGSPEQVVEKLKQKFVLDDGYLAPVASTLAWMGFSVSEAADIENGDVDVSNRTICGRPIPDAFFDIVNSYVNTTVVERKTINISDSYYLEDIGFFLKRVVFQPKESPVTPAIIANALYPAKLSYKDVWSSGRYYAMWEIENDRRLTQEDVMNVWGIPKNRGLLIADRLSEYQAFKQAFYFNAQ